MNEEIISFKTAKLAKEKGFNETTSRGYHKLEKLFEEDEYERSYFNNIQLDEITNINAIEYSAYSAPTQSLLQRWLREVHKIRVFIIHSTIGTFNYEIRIWDKPNNIGNWLRISNIGSYETYEQAFEKGLLAGLNLIKDKKDEDRN